MGEDGRRPDEVAFVYHPAPQSLRRQERAITATISQGARNKFDQPLSTAEIAQQFRHEGLKLSVLNHAGDGFDVRGKFPVLLAARRL